MTDEATAISSSRATAAGLLAFVGGTLPLLLLGLDFCIGPMFGLLLGVVALTLANVWQRVRGRPLTRPVAWLVPLLLAAVMSWVYHRQIGHSSIWAEAMQTPQPAEVLLVDTGYFGGMDPAWMQRFELNDHDPRPALRGAGFERDEEEETRLLEKPALLPVVDEPSVPAGEYEVWILRDDPEAAWFDVYLSADQAWIRKITF